MAKNDRKTNETPDAGGGGGGGGGTPSAAAPAADPSAQGAAPAAHAPEPKPANPLRPPVPGVIPNRAARRFHLPPIRQQHYSVVFPESVPQPLQSSPGVFVNPDGTPFMPKEIKGGQFGALLLKVQGRYGGPVREIGLPLCTAEQQYPIKDFERVVERTEVIFDFEEDMQAFLAQHKASNADPLAAQFARGGNGVGRGVVDPRLYDAEETTAGTAAAAD